MTEKGSDELLKERGHRDILEFFKKEQARINAEEAALRKIGPATDEPGRDFPDPDESPPREGRPEFDPLPPRG